MKRSTKITTFIIFFFLIIALIIIGRYAIGLYFQKKFSKRPPPGVLVEVVSNKNFSQSLESYCTSLSSKNSFYKIKRNELLEPIKFNKKVNKGDVIAKLSGVKMEEKNKVDVSENINNEIKSNDVVLFMKGTPVFPMCGFSAAVVQVLSNLGVKFSSVNVLDSDEMREGIKRFSNWPTIPQLYVKEEFIGGCDIVKEMHETGELIELFKIKEIEVKPT